MSIEGTPEGMSEKQTSAGSNMLQAAECSCSALNILDFSALVSQAAYLKRNVSRHKPSLESNPSTQTEERAQLLLQELKNFFFPHELDFPGST